MGIVGRKTKIISLHETDHNKLMDQIETYMQQLTSTRQSQNQLLNPNTSNLNCTLNNLSMTNNNITLNDDPNASTVRETSQESQMDNVMVIDSDILSRMNFKHIRNKVMKVIDYCEAVLVCRVTAKQKQDIIHSVKEQYPNQITLAIGDGVNDIDMLCAAHVGVGLKSPQGYQLSKYADVQANEFRCLQPLLLVHGWRYGYKNITLIFWMLYLHSIGCINQIWIGQASHFDGILMYYHLKRNYGLNMLFPYFVLGIFLFMHQKVFPTKLLKINLGKIYQT